MSQANMPPADEGTNAAAIVLVVIVLLVLVLIVLYISGAFQSLGAPVTPLITPAPTIGP
jgi:hypothetical protein